MTHELFDTARPYEKDGRYAVRPLGRVSDFVVQTMPKLLRDVGDGTLSSGAFVNTISDCLWQN